MIVFFEETEDGTVVSEKYEPEQEKSINMQQEKWQSILDNFSS